MLPESGIRCLPLCLPQLLPPHRHGWERKWPSEAGERSQASSPKMGLFQTWMGALLAPSPLSRPPHPPALAL